MLLLVKLLKSRSGGGNNPQPQQDVLSYLLLIKTNHKQSNYLIILHLLMKAFLFKFTVLYLFFAQSGSSEFLWNILTIKS